MRRHLLCLSLLIPPCSLAFGAGNIDPDNTGARHAYGENSGWINFKSAYGPGVTVTDSLVTGYAWGENIGWLNLSPGTSGVVNNGTGILSGYAWGENVGWINFGPTFGGVYIDACGDFNGSAWGENVGWIFFRSEAPTPYAVRTAWVSPDDYVFPETAPGSPLPEWFNSIPTITLAASDCGTGVKELYYALDGGALVATSGDSATLSVMTEGVHTLVYYSVDYAGNLEAQRVATIRVDTTPPSIILNSPASNATYFINTTVPANYSVTDNLSGVAVQNATAPSGAPIDTAAAGAKSFFVTATDHANNSSAVTHNYAVVFPGNIDTHNTGAQYAYAENVGWVNFKPSWGPGVTVTDTAVTGFAYAENIGWINLKPNNYGGVVNDGAGQLSGYAWGENVGWINVAPTGGGVTIDSSGNFNGWAWGENIGWINFQTIAAPHKVQTTWTEPAPLAGDLDGNGCVDRVDLTLLLNKIKNPGAYDATYDLNGDGVINIADSRKLVTLFSRPKGAGCV